MSDVEPFRMLDIDGVLYRPEDALRLGLVEAADGEHRPSRASRRNPGDDTTDPAVITSAHAEGVPDAAGGPDEAGATPRRRRGQSSGK